MIEFYSFPPIERARNLRHKKNFELKREVKKLLDHGCKKELSKCKYK